MVFGLVWNGIEVGLVWVHVVVRVGLGVQQVGNLALFRLALSCGF